MILAFFISGVGLAHLYVVWRIALAPAWPDGLEATLVAVATLGFGSVVLVMLPLPRRGVLARVLFWVENVWLGFLFLLLLSTLVLDGVQLLASVFAPVDWIGDFPRGRALAASAAALVAAAWGLYGGLRYPDVRRIELHLDRWPAQLDGFRIVQISDLHIGPILRRRFAEEVAQRVNALMPDLVAVTGDLVDGQVRDIGLQVDPLRALAATRGVYFITGNHEVHSGAEAWVDRCREYGWRPLRNERVSIAADGAGFDLAGIDDALGAAAGHRELLRRALAGRDRNRALVLLAHRPRVFEHASELGVDLQLSGHTHGGQVWPGGWVVRLRDRWPAGRYSLQGSQLYVSCGTGSWGPPMRLGSATEITELVLRSRANTAQETRPSRIQ